MAVTQSHGWDLKHRCSLSPILEAGSPRSRHGLVLLRPLHVCGRPCSPWVLRGLSLHVCLCPLCPYKDTGHTELEPTAMTSFQLNHFLKDPPSPNRVSSEVLGLRTLTYDFWGRVVQLSLSRQEWERGCKRPSSPSRDSLSLECVPGASTVPLGPCHNGPPRVGMHSLWAHPGSAATLPCPCRHLSAMLSSTARARQVAAPGLLQRPRSWFLLCVFLACQLLINYILK